MSKFIVKTLINSDLLNEFENIGFDDSYKSFAVDKYNYKNLKIFNLTIPQACILKQTALSYGADCAVHREVITGKIEKTDAILGGSVSQLKKIAKKLKSQPFNLSELANLIEKVVKENEVIRPKIVGILNLTMNSFSDGGEFFELSNSKKHILKMIDEGVDIIDIGAESTKPFSEPISAKEQLKVLIPVLEFINQQKTEIPISIDTCSAVVAQRCIEMGASIINDVSGFNFDSNLVDVVAESGVRVVIQHSQGTPLNMQICPHYENVVDEIFINLKNKIDFAFSKGIKLGNIIIDVGIGFGKTIEHNFELIKRIEEFKALNCEIMLGVSRKSLLDMKDESNNIKDIYTVALNALLIERNVDYLRVHNVLLHKKLVNLMQHFCQY